MGKQSTGGQTTIVPLGPPPKFPVQPLCLSAAVYNTKGCVASMAKEAGFSQVSAEDIGYDWHMGFYDLDGLVSVSRIFTNGVVPRMAEDLGFKDVDSLHAEHAKRLRREI